MSLAAIPDAYGNYRSNSSREYSVNGNRLRSLTPQEDFLQNKVAELEFRNAAQARQIERLKTDKDLLQSANTSQAKEIEQLKDGAQTLFAKLCAQVEASAVERRQNEEKTQHYQQVAQKAIAEKQASQKAARTLAKENKELLAEIQRLRCQVSSPILLSKKDDPI